MVKLQIDLTEEEDKITSLYKVKNNLETKEQAVKELIRKCKGCSHEYEIVNKSVSSSPIVILQRCVLCGSVREDKIYNSGPMRTTLSKI
tara:strand:+ start:1063 stop:1329 length:267 start_codon:yes stop_codon:yes gene_type:complete